MACKSLHYLDSSPLLNQKLLMVDRQWSKGSEAAFGIDLRSVDKE